MRIAVTGGTGRIGGLVVRLLADEGRHDVVPLSRRTAPYDDRAALRAALDGADTLVFVSSDGEAARVLVHHQNVLDAAIRCGVGHVVLLSGLDADVRSPFCYAFTNGHTEQLLRASGLPYSIVRAGLFTEFFLGLVRQVGGADPGGPAGTVALPAAGNRVSLVARRDVAHCLAALALRAPSNGHHDVTGPESLTVEAIASAAGYRYADIAPGDFAGAVLRLGEEPWWTYAYASMFESIRQGRWAAVSDAVAELTGREPISLRDVLDGTTLSSGTGTA
ncbi:NmrA family NAD(P)-binding protein [Micromonospora sp. NPDC049559]|uniref:NAD(P)H-binding protein n=1 Tax=Micromonospora sp. NPDC049559 TaxID=3155923 RepID=UPI00343332B1